MTNEELKALCDQVAYSSDPLQSEIARECLRLLRENEAMRVVVEAAKEAYQKAPIQHQPAAWIVNLGKTISALSQLEGAK